MRRAVRAISAVILAVACAGCTRTSEREITGWFKLRDQHPTIEVVHAFASGSHVVSAWMLAGGSWVKE